MKDINVYRPATLEETQELLKNHGGHGRLLAGGTDLIGVLREKILPEDITEVVSLWDVEDLKAIKEDADYIIIGAAELLSTIEKDPKLKEAAPLLTEAARTVASPQIRHMATIGGNICQEPRCWYYRYQGNKFNCLRKGGDRCDAAIGRNEFHSVFGAMRVKETPCETSCPNHTEIAVYMERFKNGDTEGAAEILFSVNPLAALTGRVCPHNCETGCNRNELDESVSIREVERFLGDYMLAHPDHFFVKPEAESGKRIAIVGAGPAGLTAAVYLRMQGHQVKVIDSNENIGGMLYYGIPEYRLPKKNLMRLQEILAGMGIEFLMNTTVGDHGDLPLLKLREENDAVLIGVGAWKSQSAGCPGEDADNVFAGIRFLNPDYRKDIDVSGKEVIVVGGGNTAMDAVRTAKRMGAGKVTTVYRRTKNEMPAEPEEVEDAIAEGVDFKYLCAPLEIVKDSEGKVKEVILQHMELGEPDASGRRRPVPVEGKTESIRADAVIIAIGQKVDMTGFDEDSISEENGLFVAGDAAHGAATAVEAISDARGVAERICTYIGMPWQKEAYESIYRRFSEEALGCSCRSETEKASPECRNMTDEDAQTLAVEAAVREAARCLHCGCVAVSPSDMGVALVALDAVVVTTDREIPAEAFFDAVVMGSTVLTAGEIVTEIRIPKKTLGNTQVYYKHRVRKSIDFPIAGIAINADLDGNVIKDIRIAFGAVAPVPKKMHEVEKFLRGKTLNGEIAREASELAVKDCIPLAEGQYKINLLKVLFRRNLERFIK